LGARKSKIVEVEVEVEHLTIEGNVRCHRETASWTTRTCWS